MDLSGLKASAANDQSKGGHAAQADASLAEGLPLQSGAAAAFGGILDVDLFAPHVLLDDLGVLHNVLADANLFLGHGALVDHDLFLGDRHGYFALAYLGLGRLALDWNPLDAYFLVLGGYLDALAVGPHPLADLHGAGLTLSGAGPELLLTPLHPELVLVFEVAPRLAYAFLVAVVLAELAGLGVAHAHTRANRAGGGGIGRASAAVSSVRLPALRLDIPVVDACAISRLRNRLRFRPGLCVTAFLVCGIRGVLVLHGGSRYRAVFGCPGALPVRHVHVGVLVVVGAISAPASQWRFARLPEVRVDPILELAGYLRVVVEAGSLFDGGFV